MRHNVPLQMRLVPLDNRHLPQRSATGLQAINICVRRWRHKATGDPRAVVRGSICGVSLALSVKLKSMRMMHADPQADSAMRCAMSIPLLDVPAS